MDDRGISATALAEAMQVSRNAVSLWRKPTMPKIDGERLNKLILALNKLSIEKNRITSSDLIVTSFTSKELD
jgi:DNA-binding Xre family transcriptional regulator